MMAEDDVSLFQLENVTPTEKTVGRGAYGRVIEVSTLSVAKELHQTLTDFASPQELTRLRQKFLAECRQCSELCHPNIVQFLGIYYPSEDAKLPWLVMEKMDCSLTEYLNVRKPNEVSFQIRISILYDVTLGLQYLHVQDIIHRDLSSNNILLTKQLVAKIADLGVAKVIDPNRTMSHTQAPGTVIFMPPEALLVKPVYGKPVDVFSLGCVTIHVMTHKWPMPKDEVYIDKITGKKTVREEVERREDYLELIQEPEQLKQLILKCLNDLPEQRPCISDISKDFRELKPDLKSRKIYSILFEYESLKDRLTETTAKAQELLNTYETNVQQLRSEKNEIEKQMKHNKVLMLTGYKEREDRITELEEFINDQVTELDKMEAAMKQTVANKQAIEDNLRDVSESKTIMEKEYQRLKKLYKQTKDELAAKDAQLYMSINDLKAKNDHLLVEVGRLIEVDRELAKAKETIKHAEDELATKEIMAAKESDKLKRENERLHAELDKERKDALDKKDVYKKKTEQFQLQWRKREEAEAKITTLTEQLNAQCELNIKLSSTVDSLMRKSKGIKPSNNVASQSSNLPTYPTACAMVADNRCDMTPLLNARSAPYQPPPLSIPREPETPMQILINLGFTNRQQNAQLLHKHGNNIQAVVNELIDAQI